MRLETSSFFDTIARNIKLGKSFTFTGLTTFARLLLLKYIRKLSNKKILFITSTEQSALRYSADLERLFELEAVTLPYQNISPYEMVNSNLYDYQKQISILLNQPEIVIAPVKSLLEKFPKDSFFDVNSFSLKIGDSIDQKELLEKLVQLGYKRSTMVSDIGEFSIRGDIADIYTLEENPVRIEFWGDEIVDIRYFDNETQRAISSPQPSSEGRGSIEKTSKVQIFPIYKFVLPEKPPKEFSAGLIDKFIEEGYFEGINVYQSFFNPDLVSIFDYLKDYIVIFDEEAEITSKYGLIAETFDNNYNEGLKTEQIEPLKSLNHYSLEDFTQQVAGLQKIYLNNFLSDESNEVIDIDARNIQIFDADMDSVAKYLKEHKDFQITIATDFQERVKEVLSSFGIFDIEFIKNITSQGTIIPDGKILLLTDRELFNKRQKDIPTNRKRHYK